MVSNMRFDEYFDDVWYFRIMHTNGILSILSTMTAVYFILWRSPSALGNYKWFLLNISICSQLFDINVTFLWLPQLLLPAQAACTNGLLEPLGWLWGACLGFYLFVTLLGACLTSIDWAFVYRWAILTRREHLFSTKKAAVAIVLVQLLYMTPTLALCTVSILDREKLVFEVKRRYPHISAYLDWATCTFASYEASPFAVFFMSAFALQCLAATPIALLFLYLAYHALDASKDSMSAKTIRQHKQLLQALFLQLAIPFGTFFVPYTLLSSLTLFAVEGITNVTKLALIIGTLHSFFNTVMMISKISVYRRAFLEIIAALQFMPNFVERKILAFVSSEEVTPKDAVVDQQIQNMTTVTPTPPHANDCGEVSTRPLTPRPNRETSRHSVASVKSAPSAFSEAVTVSAHNNNTNSNNTTVATLRVSYGASSGELSSFDADAAIARRPLTPRGATPRCLTPVLTTTSSRSDGCTK